MARKRSDRRWLVLIYLRMWLHAGGRPTGASSEASGHFSETPDTCGGPWSRLSLADFHAIQEALH